VQRRGKVADGPQFIIVGLGNPGTKYELTRHNAGWWLLDELAKRHGASGGFSRHQSIAAQCSIGGAKALLVKPQTFMNVSGDSVAAWRRESPSTPWILVYDDTALPPGELRLKRNGGAGGHNGVQSVIERLRTQDFDRMKIGVGAPGPHAVLADYVLSAPGSSERQLIEQALAKAASAIELLVAEGFDRAAQFASGGDAKQAARRAQREARQAQEALLQPPGLSSPEEADPHKQT
jgi:PTH1 family peptidyl-tRNA hydrolase